MTKLKRPERCVNFESIKPELREITEFYTRKVKDYLHCLKQLNEYADELENEISVLKETPKVEVLLDDMAKPLVVVPQIIGDWIELIKQRNRNVLTLLDSDDMPCDVYDWLFIKEDDENINLILLAWIDGYTVEKEKKYILKHIDLSEQYKNESVYLSHSRYAKLKHESYLKDVDMSKIKQCHFTQTEIDKLNIGSYEQIEVKVEEVEK